MALANTISIMGTELSKKLRESLTKCSWSGAINSVAQLEMEFLDPSWKLLESGLFTMGQRVTVGSFRMEISAVSTGDNNETELLSIKCRPLAFRLLKDRQGARVVNNVSPSEFVEMECSAVGIDAIAQPSARRVQISRDVLENGQKADIQNPPSSWTTFGRLASELGYYMFESRDIIYFGQPSWLLAYGALSPVTVEYKPSDKNAFYRALTTPSCNRTLDDPAVTVSSSRLVNSVDDMHQGMMLVLAGVPTFNGNYLITSVRAELLDTPNIIEFDATTPIDPDPSESTEGQGITGPWYDEDAL